MLQILQRNVITPLLDFIYPPLCWACEDRFTDGDSKICSKCWQSFQTVNRGDARWNAFREKSSSEGLVEDFISCFVFEKEGMLQNVIHLLKYQGVKSLGNLLGREVGKRVMNEEKFSSANFLIPVPLHNLKRRERGYNQSDYICKGISDITNIPFNNSILRRKKYTQSQTLLNVEERRHNVGDAFEVNSKSLGEIRGRSFIIVDDVITTGSTINACASVLREHGAERVLAASVALA